MNKLPVKLIAFAMIILLNGSGIFGIAETLAYFSDNENSQSNSFSAGELNFSLSFNNDFSPILTQGQTTSSRTITINQEGTLDFQHKARVENAVGDLCSYLSIQDDLPSSVSQSLSGYISGNVLYSAKASWMFSASSSGYDSSLQGTICNFDFIFEGWQDNVADYGDGGFADTEEINNTIEMGYWDPPVVLNEFLPNAEDYPEFIEIYNKTASQIDLNGFYIQTNSATIPINATTTNEYSDGSTIIPANGWLVVTAGGDLMNNTSGTITLYNLNNIIVDTYNYGSPDHNINNTLDWTNNLVTYLPFDGDIQDVSANGNDGTDYSSGFVAGKINQGLSFDGVNDYVEVADSTSLDITNQITLEAWINPSTTINSANSNFRVIDKQNAYYLLFDYPGANGKLKFITRIGGNYIDLSSATNNWSSGQWYHIIGTYDGSNMRIYVNGALENSKAKTGNIESSDYKLFFGTRAVNSVPTNMFFNGLIDEAKIYNRALDDTEITNHYNAVGTGGAVPIDKSYARIPDGSSNWVDPMPTPGQPNKLDINEPMEITETTPLESDLIAPVVTEEVIPEETQEVIVEEIPEETDEGIIEIIDNIIGGIIPDETIEEPVDGVITEEVSVIEETITEDTTIDNTIIEETPAEEIVAEEVVIIEEQQTPVEESEVAPEPIIEQQPILEVEQPVEQTNE